MSEAESTPDAPARSEFAGLPRWLRIGMVAAITAIVVLIFVVIIRIVLQTPIIPTGKTDVDRLLPGSCVVEPGGAENVYTVVGCSTPHQQQVLAVVDLAFPGVDYNSDESLGVFADETCKRLIEYRLYLVPDLVKTDFEGGAVSPPTLEEYRAGETTTLCAIFDHPDRPEAGGESEDLTRDLYRPIPQ